MAPTQMTPTQVELHDLAEGLELIEATLLDNVSGGLGGGSCGENACK